MAEKADDLYLPNAVLLRIIRDSLPERTVVSREARSAISKSASSFILYVTSLASVHCEKAKRKTLTGNDILAALKEMEFSHFIPALNTFLSKYREQATIKKTNKRLHSEIEEEKTSDNSIKNTPSSSSALSTSHLKHLDTDVAVVSSSEVDENVDDDEEEVDDVDDDGGVEEEEEEDDDAHLEGDDYSGQIVVDDDNSSQKTEALKENEDSL